MSNLSQFYFNGQLIENNTITLDSASAKHIWQVLRMEAGDELLITDGKGHVAKGVIVMAEKHRCDVAIRSVSFTERSEHKLHLCVAFTKNNSRNEWLLEKATELGVCSITPITVARSEKVHFRDERWEKLLVSALLQSQQAYLPDFADVTTLHDAIRKFSNVPQKYIAHCIPEQPRQPISGLLKPGLETVILIGPEGDFRFDEVSLCTTSGFAAVTLGEQRLRTETAAMAACAYFNMINDGHH